MEALPFKVFQEIAKHCDAESFLSFGRTCTTLVKLLEDRNIWYQISCKTIPIDMLPWKCTFLNGYLSPYETYKRLLSRDHRPIGKVCYVPQDDGCSILSNLSNGRPDPRQFYYSEYVSRCV